MKTKFKILDLFENQSIATNIEAEDEGNEDIDPIDKNSALKGIRFALIGKFARPIPELRKLIIQAGGNKHIGISKDTRVVVLGTDPSKNDLSKIEILNHDGYFFPVINEQDFIAILSGTNKNFDYPPIKKAVNITYDFIFNPKFRSLASISNDGITHCLGCRGVFTHEVPGDKFLYWQIIGNLGGIASAIFDPSTTDYIMLPKPTVEALSKGVKDGLISLIARIYNESKATKFTYKFILEDDFKAFAKNRALRVNDEITLKLIEKYEKYKLYSDRL